MSNAEKSPQQLEDEQFEWIRGNVASTRFMRHNPTFKQSKENAQLMKDLVQKADLEWTEESLTKIFFEHNDKFEKSEPYIAEAPKPQVIQEVLPEWGKLRNYADVEAIPRAQYKTWFKDPAFQRDVNQALKGGR